MIKQNHLKIIGLLIAAFAICGHTAEAATYYVAKSGKDTNSCSQAVSSSSPKLTINDALGCLAAGDTLYVRAGTYDEQIKQNIPSGTSWSSKVRIAAYPGETVWLRPSRDHSGQQSIITLGTPATNRYIEFDGIGIDGRGIPSGYALQSVHLECSKPGTGADHIRFKNLESIGAPGANIYPGGPIHFGMFAATSGCDGGHEFQNLRIHGGGDAGGFASAFYIADRNVIVENSELYDLVGYAIQVQNQTVAYGSSGVVIRNNSIHDLKRAVTAPGAPKMCTGIILTDYGDGTLVYNNVIYRIGYAGCGGAGIHAYNASSNQIYNNTIYGNNGTAGILIVTSDNIVRNNISFGNTGGDYQNFGSGTIASNNLFGIDPKFVNPTGGDFQLQSGSPAIDVGMRTAVVETDLKGVSRPQGGAYDMGAFEYSPTTASAAPPTPTGLHIVQ